MLSCENETHKPTASLAASVTLLEKILISETEMVRRSDSVARQTDNAGKSEGSV